MICHRCEKDKEPCLFTPSQIALGGLRYCRLCQSELNGTDFGKGKAATKRNVLIAKKTIVAYEKFSDKKSYARKEFVKAENKALIEARKRRLESEKRA